MTIIKQSNKQVNMITQLRNQMYPNESFNTMERCEKRWEDDANIYGDISNEWQISLGNGKRLSRKWKRCGGLAIVKDSRGIEHSIYSEKHDKALLEARHINQPFY